MAELTDEQQESLLRQLEFYFCDMSFPFDDFLKGQAAEDGSIAASVIAGSPRIVTLAPGLDAAAREALLLSLAARFDSVSLSFFPPVQDDAVISIWGIATAAQRWPETERCATVYER